MKKLLISALILVSGAAWAGPYHHHHHHGQWRHSGGSAWHWVAPTIIGGVVGYEIARRQTPQPVVIQSQTLPLSAGIQQNCSPWVEVRNVDGSITHTRTCMP